MAEPIRAGDLSGEEAGSARNRAWLRKVVSLLLITAIIVAAWRFDVGILEALERMRKANVWMMAAMIGVFIAARWFGGEILRQALLVLGHHIERSEAFYITIVRTYAGLVIPKAGYGAAGVYLKVKHGVNFAKSGSLLLPILLLQCIVIGPLGLASLLLVSHQYGVGVNWWWASAFLATSFFGLSVILVRASLPSTWTGRFAHFARRFGKAWRQISGDRGLIFRLVCLHILLIFLRAVRLKFAFSAVVLDIPFLPVLVASLLADIAFIISPTPNGLGTREAMIWAYFRTMPLGPSVEQNIVLAGVFLDRVVTTLVVVIFAQIGLVRVSNAIGKQPATSDDETLPSTTQPASQGLLEPDSHLSDSDDTPVVN